jgi:hypothetical protein
MQPAENASNYKVNPDGVDLQGIAASEWRRRAAPPPAVRKGFALPELG